MSYSSIATVLHNPDQGTDALEFAISTARMWGAHLHVLCAGVDVIDPGFYYAGTQAIAVQQNLEAAEANAHHLKTLVETRLETELIDWDVEAVTTMTSGLAACVARQVRYADIVVLPLPYGSGRTQTDVVTFEACLFDADVPVLAVPEKAVWTSEPQRILIAWNDGAEALAAAKVALPLTAKATQTDICVIRPSTLGSDRSDPGGRLAQLLARAGARVEITVAAEHGPDIATQLLRRAREKGADLLVMGGYGHSRLREAVLGGVTRSMLKEATLPILLSR